MAESAAPFLSISALWTPALRKPDLQASLYPALILIYYQESISCGRQPQAPCGAEDAHFLTTCFSSNPKDNVFLLLERSSLHFLYIEKNVSLCWDGRVPSEKKKSEGHILPGSSVRTLHVLQFANGGATPCRFPEHRVLTRRPLRSAHLGGPTLAPSPRHGLLWPHGRQTSDPSSQQGPSTRPSAVSWDQRVGVGAPEPARGETEGPHPMTASPSPDTRTPDDLQVHSHCCKRQDLLVSRG